MCFLFILFNLSQQLCHCYELNPFNFNTDKLHYFPLNGELIYMQTSCVVSTNYHVCLLCIVDNSKNKWFLMGRTSS